MHRAFDMATAIHDLDLEFLPKYKIPVVRQNPFTLLQITKNFVGSQLRKDQIETLEVPYMLKYIAALEFASNYGIFIPKDWVSTNFWYRNFEKIKMQKIF